MRYENRLEKYLYSAQKHTYLLKTKLGLCVYISYSITSKILCKIQHYNFKRTLNPHDVLSPSYKCSIAKTSLRYKTTTAVVMGKTQN